MIRIEGYRCSDLATADLSPIAPAACGCDGEWGNELDSWHNSAMAIFGAIKDSEELRPTKHHAIAMPDTASYRRAMGKLNAFFVRQRIAVFWVGTDGHVLCEGAPNEALQAACDDART